VADPGSVYTTALRHHASEFDVPNDTVLSLSFDSEKLKAREAAIRGCGFQVTSVYSPAQARYEIEMGRCGIFVTCHAVPDIINQDLMNLFRRYCPDGLIVFITRNEPSFKSAYEPPADITIPESQDPQGIAEILTALRQKSSLAS
jgi:hypothetical protein